MSVSFGQPIVERFVISPSAPPDPEVIRSWVKSAQAEETEGQRQIYEFYAGKMLLAIRRYIPGEQEALDVLQDGFIKVFRNIGGYTFKGSFEGWVRRIMVNMAIDALRASRQLQFVGESEEMLDVLSERVQEENEPEWAGLGQNDILEAMEQLTPVYRAVFNLYAIEGYGHRDIAIELGISEGTSKSNYAKARRNLRELLRKKLREK
ncbi:MAG: RNA polymerase sigma factor [Flavobacteriales bacterium]|jgi:RNA polymerase sigma-70 factor (ECF subfamily)|nr:RNA polymerase sigma factor [Flavobacteriales bacterium]